MFKFALAAVAAIALPAAAQAVVSISSTAGPDTGVPAGQTLLYDFESGTPAGLTGNFVIAQGSVSGQYLAPLGDTSKYLVVPGQGSSGTATLTLAAPLYSLSFYWGTIDDYNTVTFLAPNGSTLASYTGSQIPGASADGGLTVSNDRRVSFSFGGDTVKTVVFSSTNRAFELDTITGSTVPEPSTWAMLIVGVGMVGLAARRRRYNVATA